MTDTTPDVFVAPFGPTGTCETGRYPDEARENLDEPDRAIPAVFPPTEDNGLLPGNLNHVLVAEDKADLGTFATVRLIPDNECYDLAREVLDSWSCQKSDTPSGSTDPEASADSDSTPTEVI